jgi:hypothetical protein
MVRLVCTRFQASTTFCPPVGLTTCINAYSVGEGPTIGRLCQSMKPESRTSPLVRIEVHTYAPACRREACGRLSTCRRRRGSVSAAIPPTTPAPPPAVHVAVHAPSVTNLRCRLRQLSGSEHGRFRQRADKGRATESARNSFLSLDRFIALPKRRQSIRSNINVVFILAMAAMLSVVAWHGCSFTSAEPSAQRMDPVHTGGTATSVIPDIFNSVSRTQVTDNQFVPIGLAIIINPSW